jgi:hypothetical protein
MSVVLPFLIIAVLVGVGLAWFFWKQIAAEQKWSGACAVCAKPLSAATVRACSQCNLAVCLDCSAAPCPRCGAVWPPVAQPR